MLRQLPIESLVNLVQHEVQQVEPRDERRRQVDVTRNRQVGVVLRADGVRCCKNRGSGIQCRDDASFGDGDGLLFLSDGLEGCRESQASYTP